MTDFKNFGLNDSLTQALDAMAIKIPTAIQSQSIPPGMEGRDLLASAQTGTGKTLAYLLPLLTKLFDAPEKAAIILTPTRELAMQVRETLRQLLGNRSSLRAALLIGGESMVKQFDQLRAKPRLIIGTPGRICDHLNRKTLKLDNAHFLVLDESDRMLDMGFGDELEAIVKKLPDDRQTFMFSATMPPDIARLAQKYLITPAKITVGETTAPVAKIKQEMVQTTSAGKFPRLLQELDERLGSIIVFVKTRRTAADLAERLQDKFHEADAIHGDLRQRERDRVMKAFRTGKNRIMVATDIAARGLDVPQIKHVINYELPQCTEDYIHRIGRTARAGAEGNAISLISPDDRRQWDMIFRAMNPGQKSVRREPEQKRETFRDRKPFAGKKNVREASNERGEPGDRGERRVYGGRPSGVIKNRPVKEARGNDKRPGIVIKAVQESSPSRERNARIKPKETAVKKEDKRLPFWRRKGHNKKASA